MMEPLYSELVVLHLLNREKPATLQTTPASGTPKESSHTVPQVSFTHTSTRPLLGPLPFTSLMAPWLQATAREDQKINSYRIPSNSLDSQVWLHRTEASSACIQLWLPIGWLGQSKSLASFPVHCTLSRRIGPIPVPNRALLNA